MMSGDRMSMVGDTSPAAAVRGEGSALGTGTTSLEPSGLAALGILSDDAKAPAFGEFFDAELAVGNDEEGAAPDSQAKGDDGAMALAVAIATPMTPQVVPQAKLVASIELAVARDSSAMVAAPPPSRPSMATVEPAATEGSRSASVASSALESPASPPSTAPSVVAVGDASAGGPPAGARAIGDDAAAGASAGTVRLATTSTLRSPIESPASASPVAMTPTFARSNPVATRATAEAGASRAAAVAERLGPSLAITPSAPTENASKLAPATLVARAPMAFAQVAGASPSSPGAGPSRKAGKDGVALHRAEPSRSALEGAVHAAMFVDTSASSDVARGPVPSALPRLEAPSENATASAEPPAARPPEGERVEEGGILVAMPTTQAEVATVGAPSVIADGALTSNVSHSSGRATHVLPSAMPQGTTSGVRERVRAAASEVADRRVLSRGIDAEIDLGDAGRIQVRAENPELRMDIKLDADVAYTARALAEHARDLSAELRTEARDARVTVTGPSTHTSVSSQDTPQGRSGGGDPAPRREPGQHEGQRERDGSVAATTANSSGGPRVSRRARFVL
jgi:hypothetical protein